MNASLSLRRAVSVAGFLAVVGAASPALAHKVVMDVYASGAVVEGELGFSDGTMAQDTVVEVLDAKGAKIGETKTNTEGVFTFKPTVKAPLTFRANLGAGHVGTTEIAADDLPPIGDDTPAATSEAMSGVDLAQLTKVIGEQVRREVKPLRQEIFDYKEKNDIQTILGGLGYIIGLFGIGFYVAGRRKAKRDA